MNLRKRKYKIRKCRKCGCTDKDCRQCIQKTGVPCYWAELDLCSACLLIPKSQRVINPLLAQMLKAEKKGWDALSRYKFWMFGYWAGIWVHLNHISGMKKPNPFKAAVKLAKKKI